MHPFEVPANLAGWIERHEAPGSPAHAWLADLAGIVGVLAEHWELRPGRPYQPGGVTAWVAPAGDHAGRRVVLKIVRQDAEAQKDEGLHEADGLRVWAGEGTVRLLDSASIGSSRALLLEECSPGTVLADVVAPVEQDEVVAALLHRLWVQPPVGHPFRSLAGMCDWWADSFEARYAAALDAADAPGLLDPGLARDGIQMFRQLPLGTPSDVLLCTDLHAGNILTAQREPWLVIDPKPYVGDPTYDALQHMLNCPDRLGADARGFVRRMAALLDLDPERLRDWLCARCVQESVGSPTLAAVALELAR
jgi:streptomycin 6-kinase